MLSSPLKVGLLSLFLSATSYGSNPIYFTYQGKLSNNSGTAETAAHSFKLQILDPSGTCLLYEELQSNIALENGLFNLSIGSEQGSGKRTSSDPAYSMTQVFSNEGLVVPSGSKCPNGYTSAIGDKRRLKVTVTNSVTQAVTVLSPLQDINSNPYSMIADKAGEAQNSLKLNGKSDSDFLQKSQVNSQVRVDQLTGDTTFTKLLALMTDYHSSGKISVADNPSESSDAVNKNYCDANIAGKAKPSFSGVTNKYLKFDGTNWVFDNPSLSGVITGADITNALGFTPQQQSGELTGLAGMATTGILQRDGNGMFSALGTLAPLAVSAGNITVNIGTGLKLNGSSQIVPDFAANSTAGKIVEANDPRLPDATCASGSYNRWNGTTWSCDVGASANSLTSSTATAYSVTAGDSVVVMNPSAAASVTLPSAVGIAGKQYTIKNRSAYTVTVGTTSSQTIDGAATAPLSMQNAYLILVSDGANWNVVGTNASIPAPFTFNIAGGTSVNLRNAALAAGWNGVSNVTANITANIGATNTSTPALTISGGFPNGVQVNINSGVYVVGAGGAGAGVQIGGNGGPALSVGAAVTITNLGIIGGGGGGGGSGGGGAGGAPGTGCGGGGAGSPFASGGANNATISKGGDSCNTYGISPGGAAGVAGTDGTTNTAGGGGGLGARGGNYAYAAGGAAGPAVSTGTSLISWSPQGTVYGPQN